MENHKEITVFKIGSELIGNSEARKKIMATIKETAKKTAVVVIASGAVNAGLAANKRLNPEIMADKQSAFTIGNRQVVGHFSDEFGLGNVGELIVSHQDMENHKTRQEFLTTIQNNIAHDIITVVNENDALATAELTFGDNDQLSAHVAALLKQTDPESVVRLNLFSGKAGVLDTKGETIEGLGADSLLKKFNTPQKLQRLRRIFEQVESKEVITRGGIVSKLIAAFRASHHGVQATITDVNNEGTSIATDSLTTDQIELLEVFITENNIAIPKWNWTK